MNFIKRIAERNVDKFTHWFFIRYGMGEFEKEPLIIVLTSGKVKLRGGFEYVNSFQRFLAGLAAEELELSGSIVTSKDINKSLAELGLGPLPAEKMRAKSTYQYSINNRVDRATFIRLCELLYDCFLLFRAEDTDGRVLKVKKDKPPKIGAATKGFVSLELPKTDWEAVRAEFLFDVPKSKLEGAKRIEILHRYIIDDIIIPDEYKDDAVKARRMAVRKGKIKRVVDIDGDSVESEIQMEV